MKNLFFKSFFLVFILTSYTLFAQSLKIIGKVKDAETKEGLPMCNVYVNNTTIGINSDLDGNFTLSPLNLLTFDLVFTYVGFESQTKRINGIAGETINVEIMLQPSNTQLSEIEVKSKRDKKWERSLKKFNKSFFGYSDYADACEISNGWVIDFVDDKEGFKAKSTQPIKIRNNALGYDMEFDLRDFLVSDDLYKIAGTVKFTEIEPKDKSTLEQWLVNRSMVFKRSQIYFFKSAAEGKLRENGFLLFSDKPGSTMAQFRGNNFGRELGKSVIELDPKAVVSLGKKPGEFRIKGFSNFEIHNQNVTSELKTYDDTPYAVSWLVAKSGFVDVNIAGIPLSPENVLVSGDMDYMKVAGMLPLDYDPTSSANEAYFLKFQKDKLIETAYIHTDRNMYYPGEKIWCKAYLNYNLKVFNDTLSKVLYVQLINSNSEVVELQKLEISNGYAYGDLELSKDLPKGTYQLRAFTNYMRNYENRLFFEKYIHVLAENELLVNSNQNIEENISEKVNVKINKTLAGNNKEKIEVTITDSESNPLPSNFSVAVINPAFDLNAQVSIVDKLKIPGGNILGKNNERFEIEQGLNLSGIFLDKNKKPHAGEFDLIMNNFQNIYDGKSDNTGNFEFKKLEYYGYTDAYFKPKNKKDKEVIFLIKPESNSPSISFISPQSLPEVKTEAEIYYNLPIAIVKSTSDTAKESNKIRTLYGRPDYIVESKDLGKVAGSTSIINGLRSKVPSLEVIGRSMKMRGGATSVSNSQEPLVLLNGTPAGAPGGSAMSQLEALNPDDIDRIEVVTRMSNMYGDQGRNGIISVFLKDKVQNKELNIEGNFTKVSMVGYNVPTVFLPRNILMKSNKNLPTLYWNPEILCDKNGKAAFEFTRNYSSDPIKIEVIGLTQNNKPFRKVFYLD